MEDKTLNTTKQNIRNTIVSFFRSKVPGNAQLHFQHWILKEEGQPEKEQVLSELFDELEMEADESTYQDLKLMRKRIGYLERKSRPRYSYFLRAAAIFLLPVLTSLITYVLINRNATATDIVQYYVPKGEVKHITLSDGSEVWINSESYLSFTREFDSDKRVVNLTGEAYFQVSRNTGRPFVVQTRNMNIEVLGTKFNVNAYPDLIEVKTTLQEGKVKVDVLDEKAINEFLLLPNEELLLNTTTGSISKKEVDAADSFSWSQGNLIFNSVPLSDVFSQIEKKYNTKIVYSPSKELAGRRLTVKFSNNESVNDVFQILQLMLPDIKVEIKNNIFVVN